MMISRLSRFRRLGAGQGKYLPKTHKSSPFLWVVIPHFLRKFYPGIRLLSLLSNLLYKTLKEKQMKQTRNFKTPEMLGRNRSILVLNPHLLIPLLTGETILLGKWIQAFFLVRNQKSHMLMESVKLRTRRLIYTRRKIGSG